MAMTTRLLVGSGQIICFRERTNHGTPTGGGPPLGNDTLARDPRAHRATRVASHVRTVHRAEPGVGSSGASVSPTRAVTSGNPSDNAGSVPLAWGQWPV